MVVVDLITDLIPSLSNDLSELLLFHNGVLTLDMHFLLGLVGWLLMLVLLLLEFLSVRPSLRYDPAELLL